MESFVYETLQSITYMKNVSGLRAIYDLVEVFLLIHMANLLIEKVPHSLCLVVSREFRDKVWDLENMLKYFKKWIFSNECCTLLVNEKPYNSNKRNEN